MRNYIERTAEKLRSGTKVYLCPACMETILAAKMLKREYSLLPAGFCDNDVRKQGKYLNALPELYMYSFDKFLEAVF